MCSVAEQSMGVPLHPSSGLFSCVNEAHKHKTHVNARKKTKAGLNLSISSLCGFVLGKAWKRKYRWEAFQKRFSQKDYLTISVFNWKVMATRTAIIQSQHLFSKQNMQIFSPNQHKLIAYMPCKKNCLRGTAFFHSWVEHFLHFFLLSLFSFKAVEHFQTSWNSLFWVGSNTG